MKTVKPIRVFVLVNTLHSISSPVYANHCHFFTWAAKNIKGIQFEFWAPQRTAIDNARNTAAHYAMEKNCDYIMFLDDDVQVPPNTLDLLLKADKDIVAGLVMIRGYPFHVMAFKFIDDVKGEDGVMKRALKNHDDLEKERRIKGRWRLEANIKLRKRQLERLPVRLKELQRVDAVGFSCCLIKIDVLKALPEPYFLTGKYHTEDVYFCMKATEHLRPKPTIFLHTGIQCGHMLNAEPIEYGMQPLFKKFYELAYNSNQKEFSRNEDYIAACLAAVEEGGK